MNELWHHELLTPKSRLRVRDMSLPAPLQAFADCSSQTWMDLPSQGILNLAPSLRKFADLSPRMIQPSCKGSSCHN